MPETLKRGCSTLPLLLVLTGCLGHTRIVPKTRLAPVVKDATLDQLVHQLDARYKAIQTVNAAIEISAITGGSLQGEIKDSIALGGYLFIRQPEDLRIYLKVPVYGSLAMDMASDGKNFKLYLPTRRKAYAGSNTGTSSASQNGLEKLRPDVLLDSLLIHGVAEDQLVSMTLDTHVIDNTAKAKGDLIEEPEYELSILATPKGKEVHTLRVLHISRANLMPYKQEIYDAEGQIVTRALYSDYQNYGGIDYPSHIQIERPRDHYGLNLTMTRLAFNGKLADDQFEMTIPKDIPIQSLP